jgi:hypothetical protein
MQVCYPSAPLYVRLWNMCVLLLMCELLLLPQSATADTTQHRTAVQHALSTAHSSVKPVILVRCQRVDRLLFAAALVHTTAPACTRAVATLLVLVRRTLTHSARAAK